jgi:hypothetical protein
MLRKLTGIKRQSDTDTLIWGMARLLWHLHGQALESFLPESERDRLRAILKGDGPVVEYR